MMQGAFFIDGAYLDHVIIQEFQGMKVDYSLLVKNIVEQVRKDLEVLRIYYYHCLPYKSSPPSEEESRRFSRMQSFFKALQRTPQFEVREGRVAFRGMDASGQPIYEQKRVDLMMGLDMAILSAKRLITHAFLIAGDSDLIPAVRAGKNEGVIICLVHGSTCHDDLLDEVDYRIKIGESLISKFKRLL